MLAAGGLIFLAVMVLFAMACLRPGRFHGLRERRFILIFGVGLPLAGLGVLLIVALLEGEAALFRRADPIRVEAEAAQWGWRFRYPDLRGEPVLENRLVLPVGRVAEISVQSRDVIHSLWVPQLGGKIDAIPGRINRIRLLADREGLFGGVCAEYCGQGHAAMMFEAEALAPPDFAAALRRAVP